MNRYLSIPLVLSLAGFVFAVATGDPAKPKTEPSASATTPVVYNASNPKPKLATLEEIRTLVLDEWPVLDGYAWGSRRGPTQPLYATLGRLATTGFENDTLNNEDNVNYYSELKIFARAERIDESKKTIASLGNSALTVGQPKIRGGNTFPIHIDRISKSVRIYSDYQWHDYATWRDTNLPKYKELTGWNGTSEVSDTDGMGMSRGADQRQSLKEEFSSLKKSKG